MVEALGLDGCELQNTTTNRKMVPIGWDFCEVRPGHSGTYVVGHIPIVWPSNWAMDKNKNKIHMSLMGPLNYQYAHKNQPTTCGLDK